MVPGLKSVYGGQEEKREASVYHSGALAGLTRVIALGTVPKRATPAATKNKELALARAVADVLPV